MDTFLGPWLARFFLTYFLYRDGSTIFSRLGFKSVKGRTLQGGRDAAPYNAAESAFASLGLVSSHALPEKRNASLRGNTNAPVALTTPTVRLFPATVLTPSTSIYMAAKSSLCNPNKMIHGGASVMAAEYAAVLSMPEDDTRVCTAVSATYLSALVGKGDVMVETMFHSTSSSSARLCNVANFSRGAAVQIALQWKNQ